MENCLMQQEWRCNYAPDLNDKMLSDLISNLCEWPCWSDLGIQESESEEFFRVDENLNDCKELPINSQHKADEPMVLDGEELLTYDEIFSDFSSNGSEDSLLVSSSIPLEFSPENLKEEIMMEQEPVNSKGDFVDAMSIEGEENNSSISSDQTVNDWATAGFLIPCGGADSEEYKGMLLVHLLAVCAEAISDGSHDLAEIILCRLREMVSATGSTMERVAYYLFRSLQHRHYHTDHMKLLSSSDLGALNLLNQAFPFIRIPHFTANQSILEAMKGHDRKKVHIIDFDIMEGMQWPPLMEAIKSEGCGIEQLKITALKWDCDEDDDDEEEELPFSSMFRNTGRRLSEYADSLGIPFLFQQTELENMKGNDEDAIIAVNCMWELPHMCERSRKRLFDFIDRARQLNPVILTVGTGPPQCHEKLNFMEIFGDCLRNLCAVFDCSEAGLPERFGLARAKVERLFLAPMMCRPLNYYPSKDEDVQLVLDIPLKLGFSEGEISNKNTMFAKQIAVQDMGRHYRVECVGNNKLLLAWHSTILTCVSTWKLT